MWCEKCGIRSFVSFNILYSDISIWEAFLLHNLSIALSVSISAWQIKSKLNVAILFVIAFIFQWFLYLRIAIFTSSKWTFVGFLFDFWIIIPIFWTILRKYLSEILAVFFSSSIRFSFSSKFRILWGFTLNWEASQFARNFCYLWQEIYRVSEMVFFGFPLEFTTKILFSYSFLALKHFSCKGACFLKTFVNKFSKCWSIPCYLNHIWRSHCQVLL